MKQCFYDSLSSPRGEIYRHLAFYDLVITWTFLKRAFERMRNIALQLQKALISCKTSLLHQYVSFLHNGLSHQASNTKRLSSCRCARVWRRWQFLPSHLESSVIFASMPALVSNSKVQSTHCVSHNATASRSFPCPSLCWPSLLTCTRSTDSRIVLHYQQKIKKHIFTNTCIHFCQLIIVGFQFSRAK